MPFIVTVFIVLFLIGEFAVDLIRFEKVRTNLQNTTDRAVLAATKLSQEQDPEAVVRDYFTKANLIQYVEEINVDPGLNYRIVDATAKATMPAIFSQMVGIPEYIVPAYSMAEQRITDIEIMLVLDVSGSMRWNDDGSENQKLVKLKTAAKEFVQKILETDDEDRISIAIVPYNAQVNLGPVLRSKFNATHVHGVAQSDCLEVPLSTFSSLDLSRSTAIPMMAYADTSNGTYYNDNNGTSTTYNTYVAYNDNNYGKNSFQFCNKTTGNVVRLPSNDIEALKLQIDGLSAGGNTSIALGMRWAVALMAPEARPLYTELIGSGDIPSMFAGRPFDYKQDNKMKFIVVMTDGNHVEHKLIKDAYKSGLSPIYVGTDGKFAIRHQTGRPSLAGTNQYFIPHLTTGTSTSGMAAGWKSSATWTGSGTVKQLDWKEVWPRARTTWIAWQLYGRALGGTSGANRKTAYNTAMSNFVTTYASETLMDSKLDESCTLAKDEEVVVFTIAFEAPPEGTAALSSCASESDGNQDYFFDVDGDEIESAFRTIANRISQLTLTQ
jgi:hypothetical protein